MPDNPDQTRITYLTTLIASLSAVSTSDTVSQEEGAGAQICYALDERRRLGYSTISTTPQAYDIGGVGFPQRRLDSTRTLV